MYHQYRYLLYCRFLHSVAMPEILMGEDASSICR
jgi:hypothetical protein